MTKQSLIEALQQQITHIEGLTEQQLNGLLERLESQKAKLPLEDHAVVNWGISLIRAKLQEEKLLKNEMNEHLENKYRSYKSFIEESGWRRFVLSDSKDLNSLYKSGWEDLYEIVKLSYQFHDYRLVQNVRHFKRYLLRFCNEQGSEDSSFSNMIKAYVKESKIRINKPELGELKEYYRNLKDHLESSE